MAALERKTSKFHQKTQRNLDKRPSDIIPVGAWVELCPQNEDNAYAAVLSAKAEEERLERLQAEKAAKLARFRRDVRARVRELQRIKRQQQLQESFHAVDLEGRVVRQSVRSANKLSHRKNTCTFHSSEPHAIGQLDSSATSESENEREEQQRAHQQLKQQSGQVRRLVQKAKRDLAAKQLILKPKIDPSKLPGGLWGQSFTRDRPSTIAEQKGHDPLDNRSKVIDLETSSTQSESRIPQQPIDEVMSYGESTADPSEPDRDSAADRLFEEAGIPRPKHVTFAPGLGRSPTSTGTSNQSPSEESLNARLASQGHISSDVSSVEPHFYKDSHASRSRTDGDVEGERSISGRLKSLTVPDVKPGVQIEENKRQHGIQFSMYRRLYMDIEREQVRENLRQKTHKKKIQQLKKTKEEERLAVERQSRQAVEPSHPLIETDEEARQRQIEEARNLREIQNRLRQKNKETERYIRALRAMMKEKIQQQGLNPPPLCACGPTVWDANPETCANNCLFYKNPKAYAKALSSVLTLNDLG